MFEILDSLRVTPCVGSSGVTLWRGDIVMLRPASQQVPEGTVVSRAVVLTRNNLEIWVALTRLRRESRPVPPLKALAMASAAGMPEL